MKVNIRLLQSAEYTSTFLLLFSTCVVRGYCDSQLVSLLYHGCFYIASNNLIYIIFPIGLGTSLVSIHCFLWEPTTPNEFSTIRNSEGLGSFFVMLSGMVFGLGFSSPSRSLSVTLFVVVLAQDNHVLLS